MDTNLFISKTKRQKKLGYLLDKYDIENRFVVFPDKGHEFPDNWPYYLDTSIDFIFVYSSVIYLD